MRRTAAALGGTTALAGSNSVLDHDQLQQLVSHNRTFLRDFVMVIGAVVVFVVAMLFIVLVYTVSLGAEAQRQARQRTETTYLANLDYRTRARDDNAR
ncbi:ORF104 [Lymantria xylina nucleopolyhedrovirus]|uniref:ORF104 n=1 Tax=Lymantria xylina multiple nucleopolyhedrovirus TaxID=2847840 RepID=D4N2E1_9ABAC|nr:ORF104 [Lymantria xylina nucleopolyhedrovirus]ADD73813.1 ORF104 [Lymantria xylina nucleopolyhedrovirus]